ncbi:MAG: ABC transporter ATP-binding protein [Actinobacteria bacterium]|nr:ABC transporter ATP-binding protein [Actinomycetota bacterium]
MTASVSNAAPVAGEPNEPIPAATPAATPAPASAGEPTVAPAGEPAAASAGAPAVAPAVVPAAAPAPAGEPAPAAAALVVRDLRKTYKDVKAVDCVSFTVRRGEVFGILGPNGAGKTTTLEMIEGLRRPDGGEVRVEGVPSWPDPRKVKPLVGVQLQSTALFDHLTVREMLALFASFYDLYPRRAELDTLLDKVGLREKQGARVNQLSGGQQQRLSIALALVNRPRMVFLDEPTTGLDPQARRRLWDVIREIHRSGMTVILTTHYMDEAQVLCDRVAIMDRGRIIALGAPQELIRSLGAGSAIRFTSTPAFPAGSLEGIKTVSRVVRDAGASAVNGTLTDGGEHYTLTTDDVEGTLFRLVGRARELGVHIADLTVTGANLEDVFLALTGRGLRD